MHLITTQGPVLNLILLLEMLRVASCRVLRAGSPRPYDALSKKKKKILVF